MIITRRYELDMGHCLPEHDGKCYRPHGHRYVVEATVEGVVHAHGAEQGMVIDFARLHQILGLVVGPYDHCFTIASHDSRAELIRQAFDAGVVVVDFAPTAENLAKRWALDLRTEGVNVVALRVYETPNCWADWVP